MSEIVFYFDCSVDELDCLVSLVEDVICCVCVVGVS